MKDSESRSPIEVDESGWRGRVVDVTRIGGKAGFLAALLVASLIALIIYGISLSSHVPPPSAPHQSMNQGAGLVEPWWQNVPDRQPVATPQPPALRVVSPSEVPVLLPVSNPEPAPVVLSNPQSAPVAPEPPREDSAGERAVRERAKLDASETAPITPRLSDGGGAVGPGATALSGHGELPQPNTPSSLSPTSQEQRRTFVADAGVAARDELPSVVRAASTPFELRAGGVIPATLLTRINSDLSGSVEAQVREDVYDSVTGRYLIIPRGAKLVGVYDNRVVQGQSRVMVAWTRILFPDGSSLDLLGMAATDAAGTSGLSATVNDHLNKAFSSALLLSIISAGAQLSQPQRAASAFAAPDAGQIMAGAVGQQISGASVQILQKQLGISPTLEVPQGFRCDVLVDRDIVLPGPYGEEDQVP